MKKGGEVITSKQSEAQHSPGKLMPSHCKKLLLMMMVNAGVVCDIPHVKDSVPHVIFLFHLPMR